MIKTWAKMSRKGGGGEIAWQDGLGWGCATGEQPDLAKIHSFQSFLVLTPPNLYGNIKCSTKIFTEKCKLPFYAWHCSPFESIACHLIQFRGQTGAAQLSAPAALWAPGKASTKSSPPPPTTLPPFCRFQSFSFPKCRLPNVMPL